MKILLVTEDLPTPHLGGAGKHAVMLGNALIEAGHQVEMLGVLENKMNSTNNNFLGTLHKEIDLSRTGLKAVAMGIYNPARNLLVAWRIWRAIKRVEYKRFDVIHYHGHIAELGIFVPADVNFVHTLHDQGSECMTNMRFRYGQPCQAKAPSECASCATAKPNRLQKAVSTTAVLLHRYLARKAFSRHKAIFVSNFLLRRFKGVVGNNHKLNATVVHNFTDTRLMANILQETPAPIPKKSRPVVLIVGRVHLTKGQDVFLQSLTDEAIKRIEIRIVGDGPDLAQLRQKHEARGVKFIGWQTQDEVYRETIAADACVLPSLWEEPCGTTTFEALALGKTVLALALGGTPEQAKYNLFPNQLRLFDNMSALAEAVASIDFSEPISHVGQAADVRARLPEIMDVYTRIPTHR